MVSELFLDDNSESDQSEQYLQGSQNIAQNTQGDSTTDVQTEQSMLYWSVIIQLINSYQIHQLQYSSLQADKTTNVNLSPRTKTRKTNLSRRSKTQRKKHLVFITCCYNIYVVTDFISRAACQRTVN